jgi:hypothetical protein
VTGSACFASDRSGYTFGTPDEEVPVTESTFTCERCGRDRPARQLKEVMYEEGHDRVTKKVCPECLDEIMNQSEQVRGIAGEDKRAAVHVGAADAGGDERESFGTRE